MSCDCYGCAMRGQGTCFAFTCKRCGFESVTPLDDDRLCAECVEVRLARCAARVEGERRITELGYGQCVESAWRKDRWVTARTFWRQDEEARHAG